jgi:hypothetical protein
MRLLSRSLGQKRQQRRSLTHMRRCRDLKFESLEQRELLAAAPLTFAGQAGGTFVDPLPSKAVVSGVGTSDFSWGTGLGGSQNCNFTFTGVQFQAKPKTKQGVFTLGTLAYRNGETLVGTEATNVTLAVTVQFSNPSGIPPQLFRFPLTMINTTNTEDPDASADIVTFTTTRPSSAFVAPDKGRYTLELVGFGTVTGDGFTTIDRFHVREGGTASAQLLARFVSPDIAVISAGSSSSTKVSFQYSTMSDPGSFVVGLYRSANKKFDSRDVLFDKVTIDPVPNSQGVGTFTFSSPPPVDKGRPYWLVVADPQKRISESDEKNNVALVRLPELVASDFTYSVDTQNGPLANELVPVGKRFDATFTVENKGDFVAHQFTVKLYLSTDSKIDPAKDEYIADLATVPALAAGASIQRTVQATLPLSLPARKFHGKVWFGLAIDVSNEVLEQNENNNWNRKKSQDKREVRLYDPIAPRGLTAGNPAFVFASKTDAEKYLIKHGFTELLVDAGWSRRLASPVDSYFNGKSMPGRAFRIQASSPTLDSTTGKWRVSSIQGAEASYNPLSLSPVIGEPSPEALQHVFSLGLGWLNYVRRYHDLF